jgi:hypothetical protein
MKRELMTALIVAGTLSAGCAPPVDHKAYYDALTDTIHYKSGMENDKHIVLHEEEHQKRAHEMGTLIWAFRYKFESGFACQEEIAANIAGNIEPNNEHSACKGIIFPDEAVAKK